MITFNPPLANHETSLLIAPPSQVPTRPSKPHGTSPPRKTSSRPPNPRLPRRTRQSVISAKVLPSRPLAKCDTQLGHNHTTKLDSDFRFIFANCNGLPYTKLSLADFFLTVSDLQADFVGIAETHLDTSKQHIRAFFTSSLSTSQHHHLSIACSWQAI